MTITSINLPPKHQKMLAEVLKARGFPERGRSAYIRSCIEADYLDLKQQRDVDRHNARTASGKSYTTIEEINRRNLISRNKARRKASTTKGKTK